MAEGIKFTYPKGFTRLNEKGKIAFTKHNIRLDVESFTIPVQAVSTGMPTMMGKQMLGDYYLKQLVEVNKASITRYETHIIDGNVMFYLAGHMKIRIPLIHRRRLQYPLVLPSSLVMKAM